MKKIITISTILAFTNSSFAAPNIEQTLLELKTKVKTIEKKLKKSNNNLNQIKQETKNENIKLKSHIKQVVNEINNNLAGKDEKLKVISEELDKSNIDINNKINNVQLEAKNNNIELTERFKKSIASIHDNLIEKEEKLKTITLELGTTNKIITKINDRLKNDNLKLTVNFRTAIDNINYKYKLKNGNKAKNPDLLTNRLWLNMGYTPDENTIFKGKLSYNKVYGDSANHNELNVNPWITNENAIDNSIKVEEAYWLYMNETLIGKDIPWYVSVGRRTSTNNLGINPRELKKEDDLISHTLNVQFDGINSAFNLEKLNETKGMSLKFSFGRGLTNATERSDISGTNYANDSKKSPDINIYGFAFIPYDNGQYSVATNWIRAENLIGFTEGYMNWLKTNSGSIFSYPGIDGGFQKFGDLDLASIMVKSNGIGEEGLNNFLDNTTLFVSLAHSKTKPKGSMLGSTDSKTGNSIWFGANMPCPVTENGRIGVEWNKGSKYWKSITYGEDTLTGSKISTRGTALEIYYTKPINKFLTFDFKYVDINYKYDGSNTFFGYDGNPDNTLDVLESKNLKASVSYIF